MVNIYFITGLNSFLIGVLLGDLIERRFSEQIINFFMSVSYNCIYYYSKLQIQFNKLFKMVKSDTGYPPNMENRFIYEFIKNGKVYYEAVKDYDFLIKNFFRDGYIFRKIGFPKSETDSLMEYEVSDISFILIEFKIGNSGWKKITLKTEKINYYLVGNKFNKDFFIFYIKNYLDYKEPINDDDKCSLKIIDHDVNTIELDLSDKNEYILLDKNKYFVNITNNNK